MQWIATMWLADLICALSSRQRGVPNKMAVKLN